MRTNSIRRSGFSLFEALATITALAVLAGGSLMLVFNVRESTEGQKLRKDVSRLNSAVKVYVANGGSLADVTDPREVLRKLKSVTASDDRKQLVGLKGSALDLRTVAVMQTPGEASSNEPRALWDRTKQRFVIATSGSRGVREFAIVESAPADEAEESRETNLKYAKEGNWVWDYQDRSLGTDGPAGLPTGGSTPPVLPTPEPPVIRKLSPPIIAIPGQDYPLGDYAMSIPINNPNPPGSSEIFYSSEAGVWAVYTGPVQVMPGQTLVAYVVTLDPDRWTDSDKDSETYTALTVTPELAVLLPPTVNYIEMGGPLVSGAYTPSPLIAPGTVALANGADIPTFFEDSSFFQVYWTYDGSDPVGASDREEGAPFGGTFVPQDIPLRMTDWGSGPTMTVKVQSESFDLEVLQHSRVYESTIGIARIELRQPVVSEDGGTITITQDPDSGDLPVGTRLYYTLDGADPGVGGDNEPLLGTLYTGPFDLDEDAEIVVRAYAPTNYQHWFTPSPATSHSVSAPYLAEVFIGGRFALPDGTFRNVARLGDDGGLDSNFNPGLGASYGSTVGVVLSQSGGRVMAGGDFDSMGSTRRFAVVRLNGDGTVDPSFDAKLE